MVQKSGCEKRQRHRHGVIFLLGFLGLGVSWGLLSCSVGFLVGRLRVALASSCAYLSVHLLNLNGSFTRPQLFESAIILGNLARVGFAVYPALSVLLLARHCPFCCLPGLRLSFTLCSLLSLTLANVLGHHAAVAFLAKLGGMTCLMHPLALI